jgi:hypothetical protein
MNSRHQFVATLEDAELLCHHRAELFSAASRFDGIGSGAGFLSGLPAG